METPPLKSKKFLAYLLAEATWKLVLLGMLVVLLVREPQAGTTSVLITVMLAVVLVAGFIEACFIGGQAILDKYVRVAQIAAGAAAGKPLTEDPPKD